MLKLLSILFILLTTSAVADPVKVLMLGGNRHHKYKTIYGELDRKTIEENGLAKVTYTEDVKVAQKGLKTCNIFMAVGNVPYDDDFKAALLSYLDEGGRIMFMHAGLWVRKKWFLLNNSIIGGKPRGHEKGGLTFDVKIENSKHPLMKGIESFEIIDELYRMEPSENSRKWKVLSSSISRVSAETYPSIFLVEHAKGVILCCTLGHDERSRVPAYNQFLKNAVFWLGNKDESIVKLSD